MSREVETIQHFYQRFAALDAQAMAACYAEDAEFADPAFSLRGRREIGGMWAMLCTAVAEKGRDVWSLQASDIRAEGARGFAHWEPRYRFSATGRLVHNIIDAEFEFKDGLIVRHRDHFDFYRWSRQALGAPGLLLGWSSFLRNKVRKQARTNLDKFLAKA
jgi:ketosteroid isomerase-like protein